MLSKVSAFIGKHQLLSKDGLHIVALSGGADSVALLHILLHLGYRIEAAHCNFHLRGEESNRDEEFVKKLCKNKGVNLHLIHFDTEEYANLHKVSIEMAARELRYRYFGQLCQDIGADSICVAHHRDDAVETFMMNLLRGSGIHGLTGIRPRNGQVVRPLLGVSRQEIEEYLDSIGQDYVTDSTNLVDNVLRNKIRLHVLPLLKQITPNAVENIDRTANYLNEVEKIFDTEIKREIDMLVRKNGTLSTQEIMISDLIQQPSTETFLHEWLAPFGFNSTQTKQIAAHLIGETGRKYTTATHTLITDRGRLVLEPLFEPMKPMIIPETGNYRIAENLHINIGIADILYISKSDDCATLDAEKVQFPLTLRTVREGDTFCPFGMKGHKLVSDYMTDRKMNILEKRRQLVVTDRLGEIIWLVGQRTDNRYKVEKHTSSILRITVAKTN